MHVVLSSDRIESPLRLPSAMDHASCWVIVVSFNAGPVLSDCIHALLDSNVPVRIVLVDNASTDRSLDSVEHRWAEDPRLTILRNARNLGFAAACNQGLDHVEGRWLVLLNPDCIVERDTLGRMLEAVEGRSDVGMAGCLIRNLDGTEQAGCRRREPTPMRSVSRVLHLGGRVSGSIGGGSFNMHREPLPSEPVTVEAISGAFMLVRREAVERVGPLDEGYFLHCEDLDWCRRFRDAGFGILFVPEVEVTHHKGTGSRSRPVWVEWHKHRGMLRYFRKFHRHGHSIWMDLLVRVGVWGRFGALATVMTVRRFLK